MMKSLIASALLIACSTEQKTTISEQAMDDRERRHELLEATLRVLDKHPAYVDELFELAQKHESMDRLLANTAKGVKDPQLAERVANHLVANPAGLTQVMIQTLEAAQDKPAAQAAIVEAIESRADIAAAYLIDHPPQLASVSKALVAQAKAHPDTSGKMKELVKDLVK